MIEININENNGVVDDINSVIATINSKNAGISASLDAEGRLVIQKDQTAETGGFKIIKGTSDFTDKFGFTTGGNAVNNTFVEGANKSSTVLESQDLNSKLASDSAQLSTAGVTDGTFKINGVNINVSASDTLSDLAYKINTIFSADEYSHIGISASVSNGELLISTTKPDVSIDIEKGSSNFTEIAGLTKDYFNSSDLGITQGGQNAHFSINGRDYDMALSLNNDGENMIYLDTNGQVVTSEDDAVIKINVKDIGSTVIEIGRTALDDSIQKLQTFINRFNAAMNSSSNSILANDAAFSALINQIKSALTDDVGSIYNVKNALAEIGIVISVSGSTYSDAGNIRMSLSKTNGEYDYVEAFYQDPQKVLDLLIGDDTQPLDYSCAGVFTRLSDVLHNALEDTRSGYFKVTPRAIESQQKALNNEITSLTFDLNELQNSLAGTDYGIGTGSGAGGSNDAYLAILEAQYQMISEAINSLNSQYNSSLVRLILNQNNASFNPIV